MSKLPAGYVSGINQTQETNAAPEPNRAINPTQKTGTPAPIGPAARDPIESPRESTYGGAPAAPERKHNG